MSKKFHQAMKEYSDYSTKVITYLRAAGLPGSHPVRMDIIHQGYVQKMSPLDCAKAYLKIV